MMGAGSTWCSGSAIERCPVSFRKRKELARQNLWNLRSNSDGFHRPVLSLCKEQRLPAVNQVPVELSVNRISTVLFFLGGRLYLAVPAPFAVGPFDCCTGVLLNES